MSSVGTDLRQARERAGLSAEEIARRTRVQLHRIEALEDGHFESLPDGAYLDGIVRAYARAVAMDPEPLIERVRQQRALATNDWSPALADLDAFLLREVVQAPRVLPPEAGFEDPTTSEERVGPARSNSGVPPPPYDWGVRKRALASRVAIPLVLLVAVAGWGAFLYEASHRSDTRVTSAPVPVPPEPGRDSVSVGQAQTPPESISAPPSRPSASNERPTGVEKGTGGVAPSRPVDPPAVESPEPATAAAAEIAAPVRDVSGEWRLATHVESSSLPAFTGLRLGYDLQLTQAGNGITGTGRKLSENGATLGPAAQTPISVEGTITRDRVTLTFTEQGTERQIRGKFVLLADEDGTLRGRFSSTAAQSSGIVEAHRIPR